MGTPTLYNLSNHITLFFFLGIIQSPSRTIPQLLTQLTQKFSDINSYFSRLPLSYPLPSILFFLIPNLFYFQSDLNQI
jgi:hypothetical protein